MRNLFILNERSQGAAAAYGIGTYLNEYIKVLDKDKIRVFLIELASGVDETILYEENNINIIKIPRINYSPEKIISYYRSAVKILRLYLPIDEDAIFHLNHIESADLIDLIKIYFPLAKTMLTIHYLYWTWVVNGDSKLFEKALLNSDSEWVKNEYPQLFNFYQDDKNICEKVDHIITLSEDTYNIVSHIYQINESKLHLIKNGLEDDRQKLSIEDKIKVRDKYYLSQHEKILLYVGRLNSLKGLGSLLTAFERVLEKHSKIKLVIIGGEDDFTPYIEKSKNFGAKIIFTGKISQKELKDWYQIADIGLFTSYAEQCSYVGIEMLMYAMPIIASDGFGVKNMFRDGINANIAQIEDKKETNKYERNLERAMIELLESEPLCKILKKNAYISYKKSYDLVFMKEKYRKLFHEII